jgi:ornithine decarboxylase
MEYTLLPDGLKSRIAGLSTPFFLFDLDRVASRLDLLRDALQPEQVYYAVKCNSLPPVLAALAAMGCGFEANNRAELDKVLAAGAPVSRVVNNSPIASAADVRAMYAKGVSHFAFDSRNQVENLRHNAPGCRACLRLCTTNEGSRFDLSKRLGAHAEDALSLLSYAREAGLNVSGLTFHVGSQCSFPDNWRAGLQECGRLFRQFPGLKMVNLGGGYPVPYCGTVPNIDEIGRVIREACAAYFESPPVLLAEPGRYLVGDCALTGTSVIQVEEQEPLSRAVVDLSVFCGLFEIVESGGRIRYPATTDARGRTVAYRIDGFTCAGIDILAEEVKLPRLTVDHCNPRRSSRIYFACTGGYSLDYLGTGKGSGFNGAPIPRVYCLKSEKLYELDAEAGVLIEAHETPCPLGKPACRH